ncbi:MAG: hypothetical protein LBD13_07625 [Spirochaetaceae bacterium]|jgi:hypothetical protein|nr:hypothetical protein [Spirochaetaceae bacterium]
MAKVWLEKIREAGAPWEIPPSCLAKFEAFISKAESALGKAKQSEARTEELNALCRAAFDPLEEMMRQMKERFFVSPPLAEADFIALLLMASGSAPPDFAPEVTVALCDDTHVQAKAAPASPVTDPHILHHVDFAYGVLVDELSGNVDEMLTVPLCADTLPVVVGTRRRVHTIALPAKCRGVYVAARFVNADMEAGPWSDITAGPAL